MQFNQLALGISYRDVPRGGEVRIETADPEARAAIAEFIQSQRREHHATGSNPAG